MDVGSNTVKLAVPIMDGNKELTELAFREPKMKDIMKLGYPYMLVSQDDEMGVQILVARIVKYIALLTGNVQPVIEQLSMADFNACQNVVMGFFMGALQDIQGR